MNKITDDKINFLLQKKKQSLLNYIDKDGLLAIFVIGKANYGFAESEDDLKYLAFYLPTFEELCCAPPYSQPIDGVIIKDVRTVYLAATTSREYFLEVLFTPYYYMNPKYVHIFKEYFLNNREEIGRCNPKARITQAKERAQESFNNKDYFEVARLYTAAKCYISGYSIDYCFHMTEQRHIDKIANANNYIKSSSWNDYLNGDFKDMIISTEREDIMDPTPVKKGVIAFMGERLRERVSYDNFYEKLTAAEKKALTEIKNKTENGIAQISISKIVEETGISRPVYKNLLNKLEKNNISKITSQGVKGTLIEFL